MRLCIAAVTHISGESNAERAGATVVRPDVLFVCGDQNFKRDLYLDQGVNHDLILDPDSNERTWYQSSDNGGHEGRVMNEPFELSLCDDGQV